MSENAVPMKLQVTLRNDIGDIAELCRQIEAFCEAHALPDGIAHAVTLSLDELLTNTISYGYDDGEAGTHAIDVALHLADGRVEVTVTDDARAFDPFSAHEPDVEASLEERDIGGLGVFLVRQFMDQAEYRRVGEQNVVTLVKQMANASEAEA